jgi:hypothetical protein
LGSREPVMVITAVLFVRKVEFFSYLPRRYASSRGRWRKVPLFDRGSRSAKLGAFASDSNGAGDLLNILPTHQMGDSMFRSVAFGCLNYEDE